MTKTHATCTSLDHAQERPSWEIHLASALTHACPNSHTLTDGSTADVVLEPGELVVASVDVVVPTSRLTLKEPKTAHDRNSLTA